MGITKSRIRILHKLVGLKKEGRERENIYRLYSSISNIISIISKIFFMFLYIVLELNTCFRVFISITFTLFEYSQVRSERILPCCIETFQLFWKIIVVALESCFQIEIL